MQKTCRACSIEKHQTEFYLNYYSNGSYSNTCKSCKIAYSKAYYEKNKDRVKEYGAAYREQIRKCPVRREESRIYSNEYRKMNRKRKSAEKERQAIEDKKNLIINKYAWSKQ